LITWAFLYGHPGTDPRSDRTVVERDGLRTVLVPVPDESQAPAIALDLVDPYGVTLLELCGGFSAVDAARVVEAVQGRVPVGHVAYALESVDGASRYEARFTDRVTAGEPPGDGQPLPVSSPRP
jgi:hypothetical protein